MTSAQKIDALRELGYEIVISHLRTIAFVEDPENDSGMMSSHRAKAEGAALLAKGGATIVVVSNRAGHGIGHGVALTHPRDNFCKRRGLEIALGRALKDAGITDIVDSAVAL